VFHKDPPGFLRLLDNVHLNDYYLVPLLLGDFFTNLLRSWWSRPDVDHDVPGAETTDGDLLFGCEDWFLFLLSQNTEFGVAEHFDSIDKSFFVGCSECCLNLLIRERVLIFE